MSGINGMIKSDYFDKNVDFSATDFCKPDFQLWVSKNLPKNENVEQGFEPWVGQLIHHASYNHQEINVIKELSVKRTIDLDTTIGGSIDRLAYSGMGFWTIEDIKSQGMYPAKQAFKEPKKDWIIQLSVYRWILDDYGFNVSIHANIHQYVLGFQKNKDGMERYNLISIELMPIDETEALIREKIEIAKGGQPIDVDCPKWLCSYCDYSNACPHNKGE